MVLHAPVPRLSGLEGDESGGVTLLPLPAVILPARQGLQHRRHE